MRRWVGIVSQLEPDLSVRFGFQEKVGDGEGEETGSRNPVDTPSLEILSPPIEELLQVSSDLEVTAANDVGVTE